MALNDSSIFGFAKAPELDFSTLKPPSSSSSSSLSVKYLKHGLEKFCKWECCCFRVLSPKALTPIENDEKPVVSGVDESSCDEGMEILSDEFDGILEDANLLSKPLIANEFSSRDNELKLRVAYKGLPGTYTEDAALLAYPKCETVPCDDFETSFKAVESWLADKAVLPIESSVAGSIHRNYDLLLRHKLHIVGEVQLLINHCLLGLAGARNEELKAVMSHPQALVQCKRMLNNLGVTNIGVDDPAAAAKAVVLKGRKEIGAVAGSRAADIYGLDILAKGIQDEDVNVTRFLILARDPIIPGNDRHYKTSIVFTLEEGPGVLFKALGAFALRNINLAKIESRPWKQSPLRIVEDLVDGSTKYFEYLFYIDFEASMADSRAQSALENLQEYTKFIRVLGCYPVEKTDTSG